MRRSIFTIVSFVALAVGCLPNVYMVDRPTLIEEQAAGDWPDLEKESEAKALKTQPEPLTPQQMGRSEERVLQTLEGEPRATPTPATEKKQP
jgi:hypothetical protein